MLSTEGLAAIIAAVGSFLAAIGFKAWRGGKASESVQPLMDYKTASRYHTELRADSQAIQQLQVKHMEELRREIRDLRDKLVEIETAQRYQMKGD